MSVTPITPCKLESHFGFELSSYKSRYWLHTLNMFKYPIIISTSFLLAVVLLCIQRVQAAPSWLAEDTLYKDRTATRRLIMSQLRNDPEEPPAMPVPPEEDKSIKDLLDREERFSITPTVDTSPKNLQFIKSSKCVLHGDQNKPARKPKICGYRQIDVRQGVSGVMLWRPAECQPYHCRCAPTKEVKRMRKTIADNKTTVEYHRYRVFECV